MRDGCSCKEDNLQQLHFVSGPSSWAWKENAIQKVVGSNPSHYKGFCITKSAQKCTFIIIVMSSLNIIKMYDVIYPIQI